MERCKQDLRKLDEKVQHLVEVLKAQLKDNGASSLRSDFEKEIRRANVAAKSIHASIEKMKTEQKEITENLESVIKSQDELRTRQEAQVRDLEGKIAAIEKLWDKAEHCFSKFDKQTATTKADVIAKLELYSSESHRRQSAKNNEFEKSLAHVESGLKKLAEKCAKFIVDQAQSQSAQYATNRDITGKLSDVENLLRNLELFVTVKNNQLEISLASVESQGKNLAAELAKFNAEKTDSWKAQDLANQDLSGKIDELGNQLRELDHFVVTKMDQQMAIDASAAAEFHDFAVEKYQLVDTTCDDLRTSLDQLSTEYKKLAEGNAWTLSEQADLRRRLDRVEDEQTECKCSEMRRLINRSVEDRKMLLEENLRLGKEQDTLRRRMTRIEETLAGQSLGISTILESGEESFFRL